MKGFSVSAVVGALALIGHVAAAPPELPASPVMERAARPTVTISQGNVIGIAGARTETFYGIPFGEAPVGSLRFKPPVRRTSSIGNFDASPIAAACPQFLADTDATDFLGKILGTITGLPLLDKALKVSEDCLTVSVVRPAGTTANSKLPVLFWIFGGGFELGWSWMYDGNSIVGNAIDLGKPYIFVAVNYRVGAFGFMPGKEILKEGSANAGLLDQRMGLQWVADNIAAFGGDPDKVTIWGESAGAISVFDQMALFDGDNTYKGKPLFRAGIMNSGSIVPADPMDCPKGQAIYNTVIKKAGCDTSSDSLNCLRNLPYDKLLNAANSVPGILSYNSVALSYLPRPDGVVLTRSAELSVSSKKYAAVPMIIGDQEDEGTLFSLFQTNITTTRKLVGYLNDIFFHNAAKSDMEGLVDTYSPILTAGSPFGTGILNEVYPGFKRLAAILGDLVFTLTRRAFLETAAAVNPSVPSWSYLASYDYGTPILGTFHGSDLLQVFYGILPNDASKRIHSYYANFVYNMDPNDYSGGTNAKSKVSLNWPQWSKNRQLVNFFANYATYLKDDFRTKQYNWITKNIPKLYI